MSDQEYEEQTQKLHEFHDKHKYYKTPEWLRKEAEASVEIPEIRPGDFPEIVERGKLDEHYEVWIMDNGSVVINDPEGTPTILGPERAYNLLNFLYQHVDLLRKASHKDE